MGRHHIDEFAALRRVELLEDYVATLQESFDALKAKVEAAASTHADSVSQFDPLISQMDALSQFVDDQFGTGASTEQAAESGRPVAEVGLDPAASAEPEATGGWRPAQA